MDESQVKLGGGAGPIPTAGSDLVSLLTPDEIQRLDRATDDELGLALAEIARQRGIRRGASWFHNRRRDLARNRVARQRFEASLREWPWGDALDALELQWTWTVRAVRRHYGRHLKAAAAENDMRWDAVNRLHRRALQVTSEISALLRTGHASGANARWRTLHEIAVVAMFLREHDQEVAERFLLHQHVQNARGLETGLRAGVDVGDAESQESVRRARNEVVRRFGAGYESDYGWAVGVLGKKPDLPDLEAANELSRWRPYVRMAEHAIHAGSRSLFWDIGMPEEMGAGPIGPTNMGLADPGQNTALTLQLATLAYLLSRTELEALVDAQALGVMANWVAELFVATGAQHEQAIDAEEAEKAKRNV